MPPVPTKLGQDGHVSWDHIVVGAGAAGCAVAAELSTSPRTSVLLLEAGPDRDGASPAEPTTSPDLWTAMRPPGRMWDVQAIRAAGLEPSPYPRGRGLGGSGAVNGLVALPGLPQDYDDWARHHGARGWGWGDVSPTFRKLERSLATPTDQQLGPVDRALLRAAPGLGHHTLQAGLGGTRPGVGTVHLTFDPVGRRRTPSDVTHLAPVRHRANLEVRCDREVRRVLLDGNRARGVELTDGTVLESDSVVLCAGAIHSPTILLRSGVQRRALGANLQDHPAVELTLRLPSGSAARSMLTTGALLHTDDDVQVLPLNHLDAVPGQDQLAALLGASLVSDSRGWVRLDPANHDGPPIISFDLLGTERDRVRMRRVARLLHSLSNQPLFRREVVRATLDVRGRPVHEVDWNDDDAVDAWVRASLADYVHACGTCHMGDPSDESAVVDPELAVIGYEGLHVMDASVFPVIPRANTYLPTLMVGVRGAQRLRESLR